MVKKQKRITDLLKERMCLTILGVTAFATFAGGCFWCMVSPFEALAGVKKITVGYTGGRTEKPTYEEVCTHRTGHYEAVQIEFDPEVVTYEELLSVFWCQTDPTDDGGQFYDRGDSYRTAIFYHDAGQKKQAAASKKELEKSGMFSRPIVTEILPAQTFYPAEEYHQDYHRKNPGHYQNYRRGSGREAFCRLHWNSKP